MTEQTQARKYTKKPVTIDAIQWTGENLHEVICFTDGPPDIKSDHAGMKWEEYKAMVARDGLKIFTLEGKMSASPGDWIIRGVKGELYPCKPDIFELTYEHANTRALDPEAIAELEAENKRLREALEKIMGLPGEINPSNYDHDDVCELNRQFCYGYAIACTALGAHHDADA